MKTTVVYFLTSLRPLLLQATWLLLERSLVLGCGFLFVVLAARHLGPAEFGVLSYALSLFTIFAVSGHLGLGNLVVRELVAGSKEDEGEILGTAFGLKVLGLISGGGCLALFAWLSEPFGTPTFWALLLLAPVLVFRSTEVIELWFQAKGLARLIALPRGVASLFLLSAGVVLVLTDALVLGFLLAQVAFVIIGSVFFLLAYLSKSSLSSVEGDGDHPSVPRWRFSTGRAKRLARPAALVFLGTFFSLVYTRVDQVMLKWMIGSEAVGVYAAAAQLLNLWVLLPTIFLTAYFPIMASERERDSAALKLRLQALLSGLAMLAFLFTIFLWFWAGPLISLIYGSGFEESAKVLRVHGLGLVLIFLRLVFSRWIILENLFFLSLLTQGAGALINVSANLFLIPLYGAPGAAAATVLSYLFSGYFALALFTPSRPFFRMMTGAFVLRGLFSYQLRNSSP